MLWSVAIHAIITKIFSIPVHIRDVCVFLAPVVSALTVIVAWAMSKHLQEESIFINNDNDDLINETQGERLKEKIRLVLWLVV